MTTAREIMSTDVAFARRDQPVQDVARMMADRDVGALPICNADHELDGFVTDRDIALNVVALGRDPRATVVDDIATVRDVVTIGADDPLDEALATMEANAVRRLPVIDGNRVVGIVSQADIATTAPRSATGELVERISAAP
jgi:CBS domain-containing protein